jgi:5'-nucleotidase
MKEGSKPQYEIITHDITPQLFPEDPDMAAYTEEVGGELEKKMSKVIARSEVELNTTSDFVRKQESPIGNLIADALNGYFGTDVAFINGGSIRSDAIYKKGDFTMKDLLSIFPFEDVCVGIKVTGQVLWDALENSVSRVPEEEGRFPVTSAMKVVFDSSLPPGARVKSVDVKGEPIDLGKTYTVATKAYMNTGKDGFTMFMDKPYVIDEENGQMLSTVLRNHLRELQVIAAFKDNKEQQVLRKLRKEKTVTGHFAPVVEGRIVDLHALTKQTEHAPAVEQPTGE